MLLIELKEYVEMIGIGHHVVGPGGVCPGFKVAWNGFSHGK